VTRGYLALGDSYTIGEGVEANDRWPVLLAAALRREGTFLADPVIVARTGWTTSELLAALRDTELPNDFELVSLLIGVNDHYRGLGLDAFVHDFGMLLSRAVAYAGGAPGRVIVASIPDWSVTPFAAGDPRSPAAIAAEIHHFNAVVRDASVARGARFVDVTSASRAAARESRLLAADGLHPAAAMYASWVDLVLPEARAALGA
jgi:lysophospholipase L1-like esterase